MLGFLSVNPPHPPHYAVSTGTEGPCGGPVGQRHARWLMTSTSKAYTRALRCLALTSVKATVSSRVSRAVIAGNMSAVEGQVYKQADVPQLPPLAPARHRRSSIEPVQGGSGLEAARRASLEAGRRGSSVESMRRGSRIVDTVRRGSSVDAARRGSGIVPERRLSGAGAGAGAGAMAGFTTGGGQGAEAAAGKLRRTSGVPSMGIAMGTPARTGPGDTNSPGSGVLAAELRRTASGIRRRRSSVVGRRASHSAESALDVGLGAVRGQYMSNGVTTVNVVSKETLLGIRVKRQLETNSKVSSAAVAVLRNRRRFLSYFLGAEIPLGRVSAKYPGSLGRPGRDGPREVEVEVVLRGGYMELSLVEEDMSLDSLPLFAPKAETTTSSNASSASQLGGGVGAEAEAGEEGAGEGAAGDVVPGSGSVGSRDGGGSPVSTSTPKSERPGSGRGGLWSPASSVGRPGCGMPGFGLPPSGSTGWGDSEGGGTTRSVVPEKWSSHRSGKGPKSITVPQTVHWYLPEVLQAAASNGPGALGPHRGPGQQRRSVSAAAVQTALAPLLAIRLPEDLSAIPYLVSLALGAKVMDDVTANVRRMVVWWCGGVQCR